MIREYNIRITEPARTDLRDLYDYLAQNASPFRAEAYTSQILQFISRLAHYPRRGTQRSHVREGMRIIGFKRRVSIAFKIEEDTVIIMRILYGGRNIDLSE